MIPVLDLFAGPGGLSEGFNSFQDHLGEQVFKTVLSIEKDPFAHQTLKLRSFFRQFPRRDVPEEYYDHLRGKLELWQLYQFYPEESARAEAEAWNAELGNSQSFPFDKIDRRISESLNGAEDWILIGGPPCQAYSIAGRSRVIPVDPEKYEKDQRHFLYKAYLRIIAKHRPSIFVMENVKGILTSQVAGKRIIDRILSDLREPMPASRWGNGKGNGNNGAKYLIYPLADYDGSGRLFEGQPADYIIRSEEHRVPQARHRLILVGVRNDLLKGDLSVGKLRTHKERVEMWAAIADLPQVRSRLSNGNDSGINWAKAVRAMKNRGILSDSIVDPQVRSSIRSNLVNLSDGLPTGVDFTECNCGPEFQREWFHDARLGGACNHVTHSHMESDLWRYFFAACYGEVHKRSPKLPQFPEHLLPNHDNVKKVDRGHMIFKDRFRVQVKNKPATTITSHIGKDGHYFIHPDPLQCRSLTVREAARLQTFPDNYLFAGPTTKKYQQIGNAVPPLLARQIAAIVHRLFRDVAGKVND